MAEADKCIQVSGLFTDPDVQLPSCLDMVNGCQKEWVTGLLINVPPASAGTCLIMVFTEPIW
jgi:hypothetical protein